MKSSSKSSSRRPVFAAAAAAALTCAFGVLTYQVANPATASARPKAGDIMPLEDVKPGMKGHAVTVFSGTTTDRFEIEIVDIIPDFVPGQPVILFRALDPRLQHSGIVGGMSGSPIYIGDKMIGALAYGWRFNKDPLGGITPIEHMLEVGELPHRPEVLPLALGRDDRRGGRADSMLGLNTTPLPARRTLAADTSRAIGMSPLAVPMSLGGFGPRTTLHLSEQLGFVPVAGGSGGGSIADADTRREFEPGDSVSVVLIGGDNAAAPNGTVTWVGGRERERVLAFGHPLYGAGPSNFPIADAKVHTIVNSVDRSVKLSSPRAIQGTLIQDRQPAISLRTDIVAPTIPVTTTIRAAESGFEPRTYESVVAVDSGLTP
ncbi:MAG: SpoIVB peptidase S55 domain-containing protein, partial [Nannocystaceae bacterium]